MLAYKVVDIRDGRYITEDSHQIHCPICKEGFYAHEAKPNEEHGWISCGCGNSFEVKEGYTTGKTKKTTKDSTDLTEIKISLRDSDNSLIDFLKALARHANPGHSFTVIMDPEGDGQETFGFDGDGDFYIDSINGSKEFKTKDGGVGSGQKGHTTYKNETGEISKEQHESEKALYEEYGKDKDYKKYILALRKLRGEKASPPSSQHMMGIKNTLNYKNRQANSEKKMEKTKDGGVGSGQKGHKNPNVNTPEQRSAAMKRMTPEQKESLQRVLQGKAISRKDN